MNGIKTKFLTILKKFTMLFVLLGLIIFFGITSESFLSFTNIYNLIIQNTYILVASIGISFVMMGGGLDLSVGYQMATVGVFTALLMINMSVSPILAMIAGVILSVLMGAINGILSIKLKVHTMIITIATATVFQGFANLISNGTSYYPFPDAFRLITKGKIMGMPIDLIIAIIAIGVASFVYNKTYFGRYIKAMGGNPEAARLAGINIKRMTIFTFMISGFFIAIATFILISRSGTTNSTIGPGTEFICMTALILGGISFGSGNGSVWGIVTGVFILAVISNGMQLAGWNQYIQYVIKGAVLLSAVGFDQYQKLLKSKKAKEAKQKTEPKSSIKTQA